MSGCSSRSPLDWTRPACFNEGLDDWGTVVGSLISEDLSADGNRSGTRSGNVRLGWSRALALTLTGSLLLAACPIDEWFQQSIWIVNLQDGARVTSPVDLVLAGDLVEIGPVDSGKMHFHIYVDGGDTPCNGRDYCVVTTTTGSPDVSIPMPVGDHTLRVVLAEANHDETHTSSSITITVMRCRNEATPSKRNLLPNIALGKPATASRSIPEAPPSAAVDGASETQWNSGGGPPQWIEIDLGSPETIGGISLLTTQLPDGDTAHRVLGKARAHPYRLLHEFTCFTMEGQWLEYSPRKPWGNVRFLRVETTMSPSSVAWREIQVYPPN